METNTNNSYNLVGRFYKFRVLRETKLGYVLEDEEGDEYFLHHNECAGRYLSFNDEVVAFVYLDKQKRITCTLEKPTITLDKAGFCRVCGKTNIGVFLDFGISKDVLFQLEFVNKSVWPEVDDYFLGKLTFRARDLYFKQLNKQEILELSTGVKYKEGDNVKGYVYRIVKEGINVVTRDYNIIFVHKSELRKKYRLGEEVEVKITKVNSDDYNGTTISQKEIERITDSDILLSYLKDHNGVMNYSDKTDPMIIEHVFKMSKSAFKRALGHLYDEGLVILEEKKTILKR